MYLVVLEQCHIFQAPVKLDKYGTQWNQLNALINEKHLELGNWKGINFYQDNDRHYISFAVLAEIGTAWIDCPSRLAVLPLTLHLWITTCFAPLQNSLNGKDFNSQEACRSLDLFIIQKNTKFKEGAASKMEEGLWKEIVQSVYKYLNIIFEIHLKNASNFIYLLLIY